jgi:hypothetical protein
MREKVGIADEEDCHQASFFWDYPVHKQLGRASLLRRQRGLQMDTRRRRSSAAPPVLAAFCHLDNPTFFLLIFHGYV